MDLGYRLYDWCPRSLVTSFPTCVLQVPTALAWEATLAVSGYTPPSPRNDSAKHIPTTPVPPSPCSRRDRGRPRVGRATCSRPHAPPDLVGHTPLSHARRLGGTPVQLRRQPRPGSQPHFRHLSCSPVHSCESAGRGDDGQLLEEGGNGSGSRRYAHEVWWAPACVNRLKVGRVLFVGSGWRPWLVSTERPLPSI
jgi:hypothetical protein